MMILFLLLLLRVTDLGSTNEINLNLELNKFLSFPEFDGIGAISGGGATSKLLLSYQEPYKTQILDLLFKPQFGASLHLLKVEIGGDSQSTEGTEASHSHYDWEVNCNRGYEWQLIAEAKKRNPAILLYGLSWAFPGWIGNYTGNPFFSPNIMASYIINWLNCGRLTYNFEFQYIGIWNEKAYDIKYIKLLRKSLDAEGFKGVKIVGADMKWEIAKDILKDPELAQSIYSIGCHYPGTFSDDVAKSTGKPLWSSEDYSTMNTESGPGCWARILNQNFVNGNMTSTIAWNLIAAYYDDLPYARCGLMTAIEPWSGNYEIPATIWVTAHTTQFTQPGWRYLPVGSGSGHLKYGGSYVTLVDREMKNITMIFESLSHDNSLCIRPALPLYNVTHQTVTITFNSQELKQFKRFHLWRTDLSAKNSSTIFRLEKTVEPDVHGKITFSLPVDNIVTISTIFTALKGSYPSPPPRKPFPSVYTDDFEKYPINAEPDFLSPQIGSFEVTAFGPESKILVQTVVDQPNQWCFDKPINVWPIAVIGNANKSDIMVSISALMPSWKCSNSLFIGARINNSGCTTFLAGGVFFWLNFNTSEYVVSADLHQAKQYVRQPIKLLLNQWYNMSFILRGTNGWFYVNEKLVAEVNGLHDSSPIYGFAGIGAEKFGLAYYDNLHIKTF